MWWFWTARSSRLRRSQPGLPATSSPDAKLRGISRACREAIFIYDLATLESARGGNTEDMVGQLITAAKRIRPGSKLRHLDAASSIVYVQGAVQAGKALLRKVKGPKNPANFLTKHPQSGDEVAQALPSLATADPRYIVGASAGETHSVKLVWESPPSQWKPVFACRPALALAGTTVANQILRAKGQAIPQGGDSWRGSSSCSAS